MSDWNLRDLEKWDEEICKIAKDHGLDWYPITYETCDYYEMLGNMSYHGMPTHYGHWSFGKSFEIQHSQYQHGVTGLPYELIINSDPCISYLMRENPLYLQILIMAHCVGHSDFFKKNRMFGFTRADTVVPRMRNAKKRIQKYVEDPWIGIEKVEKVIDACQALSYQVPRHPKDVVSLKEEYEADKIVNKKAELEKPPYKEYDILGFVLDFATDLPEWKRDIISIVRDEAYYFMPQIRTKVMNEGWACFWHYKIVHELNLPQKYHIPFLKSHNQVVRPHVGRINPYHLGFHLFNKIEERHGLKECFIAREVHNDESFIRQYLTQEDCEELNLFSYSKNDINDLVVDEVSDYDGWKTVKNNLINQIGSNSIPVIYVESIEKDNTLILHHEHDGRDLQIQYAEHVLEHCKHLWQSDVRLITMLDEAPYEI
ncbi:MAG TPA: stage V sporulation protein R [Balneolaceae bacterium]|nr:stage V sporulation protein R [Balneolaceae bacterium]